MANPLGNILSTLFVNGFHITKVDRLAHENNILHIYKYDRLGAIVKYSILFTEDTNEGVITDTLLQQSQVQSSTPIIINNNFTSQRCTTYTKEKFFGFFGGLMNTGLILVPALPSIMDSLGHNELPAGLSGRPHDLHEVYVKECLQFIMESPARRYGIERSFESLPDGVVLSRQGFMLLLDSKAYAEGYGITADDMRRFQGYVNDFRMRYSSSFGPIMAFVVVAGHFSDSSNSITDRSLELYRLANSMLCCVTSQQLAEITQLLVNHPAERSSIDWKNIFIKPQIELQHVQAELNRISKDKIH